MKALGAVSLAVGIAIGMAVAPPAAASEHEYLALVQVKYANLSTQQLLDEGYKVCRYISVGRPSSDAVPLVVKDLGVSVAAATDITAGAIGQLAC